MNKADAARARAQQRRSDELIGSLVRTMMADGNAETRQAAEYIRNALYAYSGQDVPTTAEYIRLAAVYLNRVAGWVA